MVVRGMENRACQKRACQIQRCLTENQYDMGACSFEIDALKRCCEQDFAKGSLHCAFYSRNADSRDVVRNNDDGKAAAVGMSSSSPVAGEMMDAVGKQANNKKGQMNECK